MDEQTLTHEQVKEEFDYYIVISKIALLDATKNFIRDMAKSKRHAISLITQMQNAVYQQYLNPPKSNK